MKKKKQEVISLNYLDMIPTHNDAFKSKIEDGKVTIFIENRGIMNRICQVLFRKPKISNVYLDEFGNFLWPLMDGKRSVYELGDFVKKEFGEKAEPLYERLAKYMKNLESYSFIIMNKPEEATEEVSEEGTE